MEDVEQKKGWKSRPSSSVTEDEAFERQKLLYDCITPADYPVIVPSSHQNEVTTARQKEEEVMEEKIDNCTSKSENESLGSRCRRFLRNVTVEPAAFLLTVGGVVQNIVVPNMYLDKTCQVNFNFTAEQCNDRNFTTPDGDLLVDRVQSYVSTLNIYSSLIKTIPSIFFVLFAGPWSDTHGRKPLMILPVVGSVLATCLLMFNDYFIDWPAEYILFSEVPVGILGGFSMLNLAFLSFLADITSESSRTSRISFLSGASILGMPVGSFMSRFILEYGGHLAIWCTTLSCFILSLLWIFFSIRDSRGKGSKLEITLSVEDERKKMEEIGVVPILKNLWHCFTVTFKPRGGNKRSCLAIIMAMRCISIFSDDPFGVNYLYSRKRFGWDAPDFALYRASYCLAMAIGSFFVMPLLSSRLKVGDTANGIVSLLGDITTCLLIVFAPNATIFFFSSITIFLGMGIVTVMNALPSKLVPVDELGHVYAVLACAESILPLLASPTVNLIYANSLEVFPGSVYLFGASLDVLLIILFVLVTILQRREAPPVSSVESAPAELSSPSTVSSELSQSKSD